MHLDKQLQQIKDDANPPGSLESQILGSLRELESAQLKHLDDSCNTVEILAKELNPEVSAEVGTLRSLIKLERSSTPGEAISGLLVSIQNGETLELKKRELIGAPSSILSDLIKLIETEVPQ